MSTRYNDASHYENHQRASELQEGAEHAHRTGEQQGKQEHLTGQEHSRQAREHVPQEAHGATAGHGVVAFGHDDIAALAYSLWRARGCPVGSPEEDWHEAVKELRSRSYAH
jgi:hypothetical protein